MRVMFPIFNVRGDLSSPLPTMRVTTAVVKVLNMVVVRRMTMGPESRYEGFRCVDRRALSGGSPRSVAYILHEGHMVHV